MAVGVEIRNGADRRGSGRAEARDLGREPAGLEEERAPVGGESDTSIVIVAGRRVAVAVRDGVRELILSRQEGGLIGERAISRKREGPAEQAGSACVCGVTDRVDELTSASFASTPCAASTASWFNKVAE